MEDYQTIHDIARDLHLSVLRLRNLIYGARKYRGLEVRTKGSRPKLFHVEDVRDAVYTTRSVSRIVPGHRRRRS